MQGCLDFVRSGTFEDKIAGSVTPALLVTLGIGGHRLVRHRQTVGGKRDHLTVGGGECQCLGLCKLGDRLQNHHRYDDQRCNRKDRQRLLHHVP